MFTNWLQCPQPSIFFGNFQKYFLTFEKILFPLIDCHWDIWFYMMYTIILGFTIQSIMEVIWDPGLEAKFMPVLTYQGFQSKLWEISKLEFNWSQDDYRITFRNSSLTSKTQIDISKVHSDFPERCCLFDHHRNQLYVQLSAVMLSLYLFPYWPSSGITFHINYQHSDIWLLLWRNTRLTLLKKIWTDVAARSPPLIVSCQQEVARPEPVPNISKKVCCSAGTSSSVPLLSLQILPFHKNHVKSSSAKAVATPPLKQQTAQDHAYRELKSPPLDRHDDFSPAPSPCLTFRGWKGHSGELCSINLVLYFKKYGLTVMGEIFFFGNFGVANKKQMLTKY